MKTLFFFAGFLFLVLNIKAQNPNFSIDPNNKYIEFNKTFINNDLKNFSQLKIGTYLTLGNFGNSNQSWIGSNAILDYTSYGNVGSLGNANLFIPVWNSGTALVMNMNFTNGDFTGYTYDWNGSSNQVNLNDFNPTWNLSKNKTYFMSNVGIGTTNPDAKLTVAGNIHSREVKVTVNAGADFVFEDNYNLPSLEEVQQFIQQNGHLPEIASAKDMETNGIHLAEMNIKLLQKIEELTLYAIEQEERIKELDEEIAKIKKNEKRNYNLEDKNKELEARLIKLEQIINE